MNSRQVEIETLTFRRGDQIATVVTNGDQVATYEPDGCTKHGRLSRAMAYLETKGYNIFNG